MTTNFTQEDTKIEETDFVSIVVLEQKKFIYWGHFYCKQHCLVTYAISCQDEKEGNQPKFKFSCPPLYFFLILLWRIIGLCFFSILIIFIYFFNMVKAYNMIPTFATKFEVHHTILLTISTMLYSTSLEIIHLA